MRTQTHTNTHTYTDKCQPRAGPVRLQSLAGISRGSHYRRLGNKQYSSRREAISDKERVQQGGSERGESKRQEEKGRGERKNDREGWEERGRGEERKREREKERKKKETSPFGGSGSLRKAK